MAAGTIFIGVSETLTFFFLIVLAVVIFIVNAVYLKKASSIENDLKTVSAQLSNALDWNEIEFQSVKLNQCFESYRTEMTRLQTAGSSVTCDIEDYITFSVINSEMQKGICDTVPGFSTGIGILGTFIGLMIGLKQFSLGDSETMQESITNLIDGIKTAFLTSIYGVIYSLVFNLFYKKQYQSVMNALNEFYDAYHRYCIPDSQTEVYSRLFQAQTSQTQMLQKGMQDFITLAINNQDEKLRSLVKDYLTTMNEQVLKGQLLVLKETLSKLSESEIKHINQMQEMTKKLASREVAFSENTQHMLEFSENLQEYVSAMNEYQQSINQSQTELISKYDTLLEKMEDSTALNQQTIETAAKMNKTLSDFTVQMREQLTNVSGQMQKTASDFSVDMGTHLNELSQHMQKMLQESHEQEQKMSALCERTLSSVNHTHEQTGTLLENLNTFQSNQLAYLEKVSQEAGDTAESLNQVSQSIREASSQMYENYSALSQALEENMSAAFNDFDATASSLAEHFCEVLSRMEEDAGQIPKDVYVFQQEIIEEQRKIFLSRLAAQLKAVYEQKTEEPDAPPERKTGLLGYLKKMSISK